VGSFGATLIDGETNDIRVIGIVTLILILVLAFVGMEWVTRVSLLSYVPRRSLCYMVKWA